MISNFSQFLDYCESFYLPSHEDVLYPILDLTREELALATLTLLDKCAQDENITWGDGDSLDRERVRDIVFDIREAKWHASLNQSVEDAERALREEFSTVSV